MRSSSENTRGPDNSLCRCDRSAAHL